MKRIHVIELLQAEQGERSNRAYAESIGVTPMDLSHLYNCNREPSGKILRHLKLRKIRTTTYEYERVQAGKNGRKALTKKSKIENQKRPDL